jgi:putative iron-dependent peroxidase
LDDLPTAQAAIYTVGSLHNRFLEYRRTESDGASVLRALATVRDIAAQQGLAHVAFAFGPAMWRDLLPDEAPLALAPFEPIEGPGRHRAPATPADLWIWVHAGAFDDVLRVGFELDACLRATFALERDIHGFDYRGSRDLTGFIDGSANPSGRAAVAAAAIAVGEPHELGSFVLTQKWVHDLPAFHALSIEEQERVIGRTKQDSIEFEGEAMPPDAHVARTDVGEAKIFRRSTPFGGVRENGLYFLAFACDPQRFQLLLERMYGLAEDGRADRLLEFSRPVTGAFWFAPSTGGLAALG